MLNECGGGGYDITISLPARKGSGQEFIHERESGVIAPPMEHVLLPLSFSQRCNPKENFLDPVVVSCSV